ncbi:family A G protein-coupled receptor-like protein [Coniochaeta ligniaria NRRL 30616]|uniref:Family A G protein-coupled receptor-like protein n=1 Tax=Coniochaeta ligniaria NRRL 30616 TaxID=1408157 RepID=A0A1J7K006_9PEZI|nr:family A G protein-coupled receptor-like protein [Coniochaeta ligniaria NRRL 30616]
MFTVTLLVGATAYYAQASDLGWSAVAQADNQLAGATRQIFYAKYINWTMTFPSLALALGLVAGVSWTTIFCNIFVACFWVLSYLAAAYTTTDYKWGFFALGTFAWIILAMSTLNESYEAAAPLGIGRDYIILSGAVNILWLLYPVAFGLSDGGNRIGVTGGSIFFGVLDVLIGPGMAFAFLFLARKWDYGKLKIDFSESRHYRGTREGAQLGKETTHRVDADPSVV